MSLDDQSHATDTISHAAMKNYSSAPEDSGWACAHPAQGRGWSPGVDR